MRTEFRQTGARAHEGRPLQGRNRLVRRGLPMFLAVAVSCLMLTLNACIASRGNLLGPLTITSFTAYPAGQTTTLPVITPGQPVILAWAVSGATSISISDGTGPISNATAASGNSVQVTPTTTTTYTLTATGPTGSISVIVNPKTGVATPASAVVTVVPNPVISSFTATPSTIALGQTTELNWTVANDVALSLQAQDPVTGIPLGNSVLLTGIQPPFAVQPVQNTTFVLLASSSAPTGVAAQAQVTVTVNQVPLAVINSFTASSLNIGVGQSTTLSWSVTNATALTIQESPGAPVTVTGSNSYTASPTSTTTYTLVAMNSAGVPTTSQPLTITVSTCPNPAITSFSASPVSTGAGNAVSLNAVFDGNLPGDAGAATIDNGVGTVTSGNPVTTPVLNTSTSFVITVKNSCGSTSAATARVPVGSIALFAGESSPGSADGQGGNATFFAPSGMAVDSQGNVYVADQNNYTVRMITPSGNVTTIAGTPGVSGFVDGTGAVNGTALFGLPIAVAVDAAGNVYVADYSNNAVRVIAAGTQAVTTLAGSPVGTSGYQDGTGSDALFALPQGIAVTPGGNVYVAESRNNTIRSITPGGVVTTLAGPGPTATNGGGAGYSDGTGTAALFNHPLALTIDTAGNLYVADEGNYLVRKVTSTGVVTTLAGTPPINGEAQPGSVDGPGASASFGVLKSITSDAHGNIYVGDTTNFTIRRLTPSQTGYNVDTIIGTSGSVNQNPNGPLPGIFGPTNGIVVDPSGVNLYTAVRNAIFTAPY